MIAFDEAAGILAQAALPLGLEAVKLADAQHRILADPVIAAVHSPPADMSAMDGYAVREADLADLPTRLDIAGEIFAGSPDPGTIYPGECARIFTGAPIPAGADRVVIQEVVEREGDRAIFSQPLSPSCNIRKRGNDFAAGDTLLPPGRKLDFRALVAAAGADVGELTCWRIPRVALLATGDELVEPGMAGKSPGAIPESVSYGIAALIRDFGGRVTNRMRLADDVADMEASATEALGMADLVVVTGGASVGEKDFAKRMFAPAGLELIFSKVAMKPGKPVWFGRAAGKLVIGLPGNPTSALATARLFLAPLVAGLAGGNPAACLNWHEVSLASDLPAVGDRETFVRARLDGKGRAVPIGNQDSSAQHALADADLLLRRRPGTDALAAGSTVEALGF